MESKQVQLYLDREKTIEASPVTSADCVMLTDGNNLQNALDNDLTTPTVVHEETSFKVGQGDIDVSGSIVDGEVGRMVIKGQTYQNILPEPSLRNSMTNGKTMQRLNEGYDSVNTVDGVCKSAILSGQTLVNGLSNPVRQNNTSYITIVSPTHLIINHGENITEEKASVVYQWFDGKMGDGVDYTLDIWILKNTMHRKTDPNASIGKINFNNYNTGFYSIPSNTLGHITYEVTTSKTNTGGKPYIETFTTCEGELEIQMVVRQGRNLEPIEKHFEGMASCKLPVLTTTGKNLCGEINKKATFIWAKSYEWENDVLKLTLNDGGYNAVRFPIRLSKGNYHLSASHNGHAIGFRVINDSGSRMVNPITLTKDEEVLVEFMGNGGVVEENKIITFSNIQLEQNTTQTPYEPYKSNILTVNDDVTLRGIGDVKDELNVVNGELTQRIGEVVLDGSEVWSKNSTLSNNYATNFFTTGIPNLKRNIGITTKKSDKFKVLSDYSHLVDEENVITSVNGEELSIRLSKDINDISQLKNLLQQNPITVQYQLITPIIKTVDLSSSGNWEKVVLDGSEDWAKETLESGIVRWRASLPNAIGNAPCYCDKLPVYPTSDKRDVDYVRCSTNLVWVYQKDTSLTPEQFRAKLQSNPLTVWYQVKTHQDSTQVKQPIFFKDGHIQLSSGADNSLIPTLDYEAKTSNSYVMDLMKTNTRYTMKAKSASGTFTIDGTSYGAGTNGTFTTPTSMTNKLLVMSDTAHEEVMILEGDVTDKTIPYFKGIKSAFEDEDKIEVLSTGKNLFNIELVRGAHGYGTIGGKPELSNTYTRVTNKSGDYILVKPNTKMTFTINNNIYTAIAEIDKDGNRLGDSGWRSEGRITITTKPNTKFIGFNFRKSDNSDITVDEVYQASPSIEESPTQTFYEPYKSNSAKIPLLSPLRSLPNGVCDELIVDRMKKKATLIQRVGYVTLGQGDGWGSYENVGDTMKVGRSILPHAKSNGGGMSALIPYTFNSVSQPNEGVYIYRHASSSEARVRLKLKRTGRHDAVGMQNWLRDNNIVTLYELETPIITEIDLESFPLVYKDGHIFLNSEIAPVVEIDYNVNQSQQIQANNETLQRHELDILDLDNLIVSFVNAEYNLRLLKFDMELSMMALAE